MVAHEDEDKVVKLTLSGSDGYHDYVRWIDGTGHLRGDLETPRQADFGLGLQIQQHHQGDLAVRLVAADARPMGQRLH